jgi:EmrB/QacA subfamily drug resistance transporter
MKMQVAEQPLYRLRNGRVANPWLALLAMGFGLFMALLDLTIVTIALPNIVQRLGTDLTTAGWVLDAYNLVFAVLLVTVGRLADVFGRKRVFMGGMALFTLGSLLCGLAPAIGWLIGFRAFQAAGAACLTPVSLAIIMAIFPRERRGTAIGLWGAASGLATALGPVLGGFLVEHFSWRWIFYVNLPFCLVGLVLVALFVPETRQEGGGRAIDLGGLVTLSAALLALVLAILEGNAWGWSSPVILTLFGGAALALLLFGVLEMRVAEPMVNFRLFALPSFMISNVAMLLFGIAIQGAFLILVIYLTGVLRDDQLQAAYELLPLSLTSFVAAGTLGAFSRRLNLRLVGMAALLLLAIAFLLLALWPPATVLAIICQGGLIGVGMGFCFQGFPGYALSEVPRGGLGVASGIFNTFRQVGFALGVAVLIALFTAQMQANIAQARQEAIALVQADQQLPASLRQSLASALRTAGAVSNEAQVNGFGPVDLRPLANQLPPGPQRTALREHLQQLSARLSGLFHDQAVAAFSRTWLASAGFAALGCLSVLLTGLFWRGRTGGAGSQTPAGESAAARTTISAL